MHGQSFTKCPQDNSLQQTAKAWMIDKVMGWQQVIHVDDNEEHP